MHVTATALPFYCGPLMISIDLASNMYRCCTCSLASMKLAVAHTQTIRNHTVDVLSCLIGTTSEHGRCIGAYASSNIKSYADKALDSKHG